MLYFSRFKSKKIFKLLLVVLLCALISNIFFSGKKSYAEEIFLFPKTCEGTWTNSRSVAGERFINDGMVGARSTASGDEITCQSFSGVIPADIVITSATINFLWQTTTENQPAAQPPTVEESYDPIVEPGGSGDITTSTSDAEEIDKEIDQVEPSLEVESELPPASKDDKIPSKLEGEATVEEKSTPKEDPVIEPDIKVEPVPDSTEPVSWYRNLLQWLPIAFAQAQVVDKPMPTIVPLTESKIPEESFKIISSTIDSQTKGDPIEVTADATPLTTTTEKEAVPELSPSLEQTTETNLFKVDYQFDDSPAQELGFITQESLDKAFSIPLTLEAIPKLRVRLTSLLTLDEKQLLELVGMKLVILFENNTDEDPMKQPNLEVDTLINTIQADQYEVIHLQRADTKALEIWYRELSETELADNKSSSKEETEEEIEMIDKNTETSLPDPVLYWNFVAGGKLVHETLPIAFHDDHIFWFNTQGNALYVYSILTQGINSQSFSPQDETVSVIYFGLAKEGKKAQYDQQSLTFSFFDEAL